MLMRRVAAIAVVAAAVLVMAGAWIGAFTCAPATGPRHMTWHKADGSPPTDPPGDPYPFDGCRGDIGLTLAVWNGGVIMPCEDEAIGIGWAFLDPRTHDATLRWPLAPGGKSARTRGLIPGPDGQLAIVFETNLPGDIVVGIARADGWTRPPDNLGRAGYLAAAWVGGTLELVIHRTTADDKYGMQTALEVITLDGAARRTRIAVAACNESCMTPQIVYRAGARWVFEGNDHAVAEGGEAVPAAFSDDPFVSMIDRSAHGDLEVPAALALGRDAPVIDAAGKPAHPPPPPRAGLRVARQTRYAIGATLERRTQWVAGRNTRAVIEQVGGRTLTWHTDDDDRVRIAETSLTPEEVPAVAPVVHWSQGLATRVFVPDDAGGFWLVDGSGEYIHLDRALHRTDPLPLRTHLRQRGSLGPHIDEPSHVWTLGWALFGLPVLLAGYAVLAVLAGEVRAIWRIRTFVVVAVVYLATAAWALLQVAPLLR
jgi:hypothetical protein